MKRTLFASFDDFGCTFLVREIVVVGQQSKFDMKILPDRREVWRFEIAAFRRKPQFESAVLQHYLAQGNYIYSKSAANRVHYGRDRGDPLTDSRREIEN